MSHWVNAALSKDWMFSLAMQGHTLYSPQPIPLRLLPSLKKTASMKPLYILYSVHTRSLYW